MGTSDFCFLTFVAVLLQTISRLSNVSASGYFELQILEISNTNNHLLSSYCCGMPPEMMNTKTTGCPPCSTAFRLCLKEYQSTPQTEPGLLLGCSFGNASTVVLGGSSFVLSDPEVGSIVLPFTFRWTKSFTLILQALDLYNSSYTVSDQLIEETSFSGVILPSPEWNTLDHIGKNARITYRVRVQCDPNYYNTTCTTFCRPRNDQFGHYTCGDKGNKVCLPGWQGANCEKAICKPGCDAVHGKCDQPGECECRPGWEGPLCADCTVYPGCRHGYCNGKAWQCICDTNWGGILCDQDLNYCGTHEPCMHGGTCENTAPDKYQCTCAEGLSGLRCEIVEHPCATLPCKNGGTCTLKDPAKYDTSQMKAPSINSGNVNSNIDQTQQTTVAVIRGMRGMSSIGKPMGNIRTSDARTLLAGSSAKPSLPQILPAAGEFTCTCAAGWTGPTCEINIDECAGGPCEHGGTCIDLVGGFRCECPTQWTGELCQIDVDECESNSASPLGPCINAQACHNTPGAFHCACLEGWGGATCAKDLDDCVGQCRNGATCIDLVNDYHCACAVGYTGRDCSTDIDECANSPCRNGGECVDMIGTFKCICPVGYSGSLCEVNEAKDYCTPSPCIEGSCLNTPSGYYCHCPPGRSGRHCEHPRAPCETPPCNEGCTPTLVTSVATSMSAILLNLTTTSTPSSVIPCNGRGKCESSSTNGPYCVCQLGFTGPFCQHNLNECSSNPCKNNGICIDGDNDFSCDCTSGWTGKICGERATQCLPGQCLNGGSCVPSPLVSAAAQCRCTSGWGGPFCSEPVDQCQGQPCHNGGTCESGPGWFRCLCARGFSGPDCRINVNECSPQPCLGGATCQDGIGGFTCICPSGRRGMRCEILLSDPSSVCLNASTLSPYNPLNSIGSEDENGFNQTGFSQDVDENNCNACFCSKGKPACTNLWCGLPNCLASSKTGNITNKCEVHEVCVPATQETCLSPPCEPRGDCRALEPSRRVAPPKLPAPITCWPNQAILGDQCARFTILLEGSRLSKGTSVEGVCSNLRTLLAAKLVRNSQINSKNILVLLCDLKTETNDTIELTVSSQPNGASTVSEAVRLLGELLSRQGGARTYNFDQADSTALAAILEVKVETALIQNENTGSGYLVAVACGAALAALCLGVLATLMWRQRISSRSGSGINLSPTMDVSRHEDEKSNNLQNEENFRRYANPLKGSTGSLRGAMELSMTPAPEATTVATLAGPSAVHRSQPLFPPREADFDKDPDNSKSHRSSQILLYKAQNPDMRKNTVGSIESPHKDFGKRAINCQPMPANIPATPVVVDSDVLTVHV